MMETACLVNLFARCVKMPHSVSKLMLSLELLWLKQIWESTPYQLAIPAAILAHHHTLESAHLVSMDTI